MRAHESIRCYVGLVPCGEGGEGVGPERQHRVADDKTVHQNPPATTDDDDTTIKPAEPDFTLVSLPTSLRLPQFKGAFRVTHRFAAADERCRRPGGRSI